MAYQQSQYVYPPQGGAGYSHPAPPPVAPAYGQQAQQPTYGYPQAPAPTGYQQPYQQQQTHQHQPWQPQAPPQPPQQPAYQGQPAYPHQALHQGQQPSYPPQQPTYSQPPAQHQPSQHQYQTHQHQQPQYQPQFTPQQPQQHQPYPPQPQPQHQHHLQPQPQIPQSNSQFPPGTYPLLPLPNHPLSKPTKLPFSLTLSSPVNPTQPFYTLTYNPLTSSLSLSRNPPSQPSTPIATATFPNLLSLNKSPASLGPYSYQIDSKFVSFCLLPGQSLKWSLVTGALVLTPDGRKEEVIAKFVGTDAAGKVAVPGGTKKYIQGKVELLRVVTQAQMDEVVLTLGVELERKRRQAGGQKTAEGTWWGSQILSGVLSG